MLRIWGHLRVFGLKRVGHLRILTRDLYSETKSKRNWMRGSLRWPKKSSKEMVTREDLLADLHTFAFTCQHLLRWLFGPSQRPSCKWIPLNEFVLNYWTSRLLKFSEAYLIKYDQAVLHIILFSLVVLPIDIYKLWYLHIHSLCLIKQLSTKMLLAITLLLLISKIRFKM